LPDAALDKEINDIKDLGVSIETNTRIESVDDLFEAGADAVFISIGASKGIQLGIPGDDDPRVLEGVSFLSAVNLGQSVDVGPTIAVVGGGNVAIDAARVAKRLGGETVYLLYRRTREEMPADEEEIDGALEEGIDIRYLVTPVSISSQEGGLSVTCLKMAPGEPDASGRRRPEPVAGSEFELKVNQLIVSIGQKTDVPDQFSIDTDRRKRIMANMDTGQSSREGVFAGGDAVSGPATVIEAIAAGRKAAMAMDKYLGGNGYIKQRLYDWQHPDPRLGVVKDFGNLKRAKATEIPVNDRMKPGFPEIERTFDEETALKEASRCLRCRLRLTITAPPLPPS
jgi:NADPH-dependent glutamate synthase beta subunit-like oxidoreductase